MQKFKDYSIGLKDAIKDQNFQSQCQIISQLTYCIEQSDNKESVIHEILSVNIVDILNDVISSQLTVLISTLKLIRQLIKNSNFRNHKFLNIFRSIIRVLILSVQSGGIEKSQLEFFQVLDYLDILLKKYTSKSLSVKDDDDPKSIFVCLLKFIDLANSEKCFSIAVKNLMIEIYIHFLSLVKMHECNLKNFDVIMKVSNLAVLFLDYLHDEYVKDPDELWLFKILEILFRFLESCQYSDKLLFKCFENIFYKRVSFVLKQIMVQNSSGPFLTLFKCCVSMFNVILWNPKIDKSFTTKIIKKFINLKFDSNVFSLSSRKICKYTQYSMKIFLSSLVFHSENSFTNKHSIVDTFLRARIPNSLLHLSQRDVIKNTNLLVLLYGCSFLQSQLRSPFNANKILENLTIILQHSPFKMSYSEVWTILRIFSFFSNYAVLNALEYTGVHGISVCLLEKVYEICVDKLGVKYPIDKYMLCFVREFSPNTKIINEMMTAFISQEPTQISTMFANTIKSSEVLPFVFSNNYNQIVNAVNILHTKSLRTGDLDFIVKQCLSDPNSEDIMVEGAFSLIMKNSKNISRASAKQVFQVTTTHLEVKRKRPVHSKQLYCLMLSTCASLMRFSLDLNLDIKHDEAKREASKNYSSSALF